MTFKFLSLLILSTFCYLNLAIGQTSFTSTSATGAWNTARWNNASDAAPYDAAFTTNNNVSFTSGTYNIAGMGAKINVGNITVANGVTVNFTSISDTFATNSTVRTITVGSGGLFDLNSNLISSAGGTGFIKDGAGVFATGAGAYTGGFTLNAGTVVARIFTGLGNGPGNTLTLNGGTLATSLSNISFSNTFPSGITIGGDVQFGEISANVSLATAGVIGFGNTVSLGSSLRTLTLGNSGSANFGGVISGSAGITFTAN